MSLRLLLAGTLAEVAEGDIAMGWLWLCWDPQGAARISMGPPPERGAAAEAFSFGAQMAGQPSALFLYDVHSVSKPLKLDTPHSVDVASLMTAEIIKYSLHLHKD